jgi:hypothetical protein
VGGESADDTEIDIDFTDLAKDMELGFMGTFAAERNSWLFESFELMLGYRYLEWDFDDDPAFGDLDLGGPMLGARWRF